MADAQPETDDVHPESSDRARRSDEDFCDGPGNRGDETIGKKTGACTPSPCAWPYAETHKEEKENHFAMHTAHRHMGTYHGYLYTECHTACQYYGCQPSLPLPQVSRGLPHGTYRLSRPRRLAAHTSPHPLSQRQPRRLPFLSSCKKKS